MIVMSEVNSVRAVSLLAMVLLDTASLLSLGLARVFRGKTSLTNRIAAVLGKTVFIVCLRHRGAESCTRGSFFATHYDWMVFVCGSGHFGRLSGIVSESNVLLVL